MPPELCRRPSRKKARLPIQSGKDIFEKKHPPERSARLMNQRSVFSQLLQWIPRYEFQERVDHYQGDKKVRRLPCWAWFVGLLFGQLTGHNSLRAIEAGLAGVKKEALPSWDCLPAPSLDAIRCQRCKRSTDFPGCVLRIIAEGATPGASKQTQAQRTPARSGLHNH